MLANSWILTKVVLASLLLFTASIFAEPTEPYVWPLAQPRVLTSSFGEYRTDRFHMGIDLRTGPIGKDVFAAEAGYIARVRCSPYGYGKVVYLQLDDGTMAIYAHLSDFMPGLRDYVRVAQHDRKKYTVDLYPDAEAFPIKRGQQIAKSGQTGIGVPHLHWELRDTEGVPINPRLLNVSWPDSTAPRFRNLLVIPRTPDTLINGDYLPVVIPVTRVEGNRYSAKAIEVQGTVAFGVDLYDPANRGASKLGVHRIETRADDELVFELNHDRIGYSHVGDGVVAYHPYYRDKGKFLMQWPSPGIETEMYSRDTGNGEISVEATERNVVIEAQDFFDHSARVEIALRPMKNKPIKSSEEPFIGSGAIMYDTVGDWLLITARFSTPESQLPVLLESGKISTSTKFDRVSATTFRARFRSAKEVKVVGLSVDHPRAGKDEASGIPMEHRFMVINEGDRNRLVRGDGLALDFQLNSVYGRLYATVGITESVSVKQLTPEGQAYRVWPENAPLRNSVTVTLPMPELTESGNHLGVYRNSGKSWKWISATHTENGIRFKTRKLGTFQLMNDDVKPTVRFISPKRSGSALTSRSKIQIHVEDKGSGIADWSVIHQGKWLLFAYDPEQDLLIWERDIPLSTGIGDLQVTVNDEAGNETVKSIQLTVR